jgi:hypothetical protein
MKTCTLPVPFTNGALLNTCFRDCDVTPSYESLRLGVLSYSPFSGLTCFPDHALFRRNNTKLSRGQLMVPALMIIPTLLTFYLGYIVSYAVVAPRRPGYLVVLT